MEHVGKIHSTRNYGNLIVTNYVNNKNVFVRFLDTGYETKAGMRDIKTGNVRDRLSKSVYGVGVIGNAVTTVNGKHSRVYVTWSSMLQRCYSDVCQKKHKTYIGCTVSDNFKNFEFFSEWFCK